MELFVLIAVSLSICTLVDVAHHTDWQVRTLERRWWLLVAAALPVAGPAAWMVFGRAWHPVPLPDQRMHPAMYFALERQCVAAEAEADFRRQCRERADAQRAAARIGQAHPTRRDPECDAA